jgi:hypothetical protein
VVEVEGGRVDLLEAGALGVFVALLVALGEDPFAVLVLGQFDLLAVDGHGLGLAVGYKRKKSAKSAITIRNVDEE